MKLIIKDIGNLKHAVHGISLVNGIRPTINTLTEEELREFDIPEIEPAVWFKILVIESITIDCTEHVVTWRSSSRGPGDKSNARGAIKRLSLGSFLQSDEHSQQAINMLDDSFHETHLAVEAYIQSQLNNNENTAKIIFYQNLFSILHRYILPALTLGKDDILSLHAALDYQMKIIEDHDASLVSETSYAQSIEASQRSMRLNYYNEIVQVKDGSGLNITPDVATLLYNHVQDDLAFYSQQLAEAQTDVSIAKQALLGLQPNLTQDIKRFLSQISCDQSPSSTAELVETSQVDIVEGTTLSLKRDLEKFRQKRNHVFETYKLVLLVRETLGEYVFDRVIVCKDAKSAKIKKRQVVRSKLQMLKRKKKEKSAPKRDSWETQYQELETERTRHLETAASLLEHKVTMLSVKEGIRIAIEELKTETVAFGVDFDNAGSVRATDVKRRQQIPGNWLSLNEQVSRALESPPLSAVHGRGVQKVVMQCDMFLKLHSRYLMRGTYDSISESNHSEKLVEGAQLSNSSSTVTLASLQDNASINARAAHASSLLRDKSTRNNKKHRETSVYSDLAGMICVAHKEESCREHAYAEQSYEQEARLASLVAIESGAQEHEASGREQGSDVEDDSDASDLVIIHDTSPEYARTTLEKINQAISHHMHQTVVALQGALERRSRGDYDKVLSCYEVVFFSAVSASLTRLYALAYAVVVAELRHALRALTPHALAMDNQVILQLLEPATENHDDMFDPKADGNQLSLRQTDLLTNSESWRRSQKDMYTLCYDTADTESLKMTPEMDSSVEYSVKKSQELNTSKAPAIHSPLDTSQDECSVPYIVRASSFEENNEQDQQCQRSENIGLATLHSNIPENDHNQDRVCKNTAKEMATENSGIPCLETTDENDVSQDDSLVDVNPADQTGSHVNREISENAKKKKTGPEHDSKENDADVPRNNALGGSRTIDRGRGSSRRRPHIIYEEEILLTSREEPPPSSSIDMRMNLAEQYIRDGGRGELHFSTQEASSRGCSTATTSVCSELDSTVGFDESLVSTTSTRSSTHRSKYASVVDKIALHEQTKSLVEHNVAIYYPFSVLRLPDMQHEQLSRSWQERCTWPQRPGAAGCEEAGLGDVEFASDAILLQQQRLVEDDSAAGTEAPSSAASSKHTVASQHSNASGSSEKEPSFIESSSRSLRLLPEHAAALNAVVKHLRALCHETTPTDKLQLAFKALHALGKQVTEFQLELSQKKGAAKSQFAGPSADDLTDCLVVLLCNCDPELVADLYISVQLMRDHMPCHLERGPHGFALMQLAISLHFLQERICMQRALLDNRAAADAALQGDSISFYSDRASLFSLQY